MECKEEGMRAYIDLASLNLLSAQFRAVSVPSPTMGVSFSYLPSQRVKKGLSRQYRSLFCQAGWT